MPRPATKNHVTENRGRAGGTRYSCISTNVYPLSPQASKVKVRGIHQSQALNSIHPAVEPVVSKNSLPQDTSPVTSKLLQITPRFSEVSGIKAMPSTMIHTNLRVNEAACS